MTEQKNNEKNCKVTLYIDTPIFMLRPFVDYKSHSQVKSLIHNGHFDSLPFTGHSFIGLTDEKGNEERWGYTTKAQVASVAAACRGIEGDFISENENKKYNEAIVYPVTKDQYLAAKQKAEEYRAAPGTYKLFEKNCSTVARDILSAAQVDDLPGKKLGLTPYGLAFKKRLTLVQRRCEALFFNVKNTIKKVFGNKKAPRSELLASLRAKPLPVPIRTATRTAKKTPMAQLNTESILTNIARGR